MGGWLNPEPTNYNDEESVFLDVTPCSSSKADVSEERIASIIKMKGISE
jgi:hypothetical protein